MSSEVLPEGGGVGEVEVVADLADGHVGIGQHGLGFEHHIVFDPVASGLACHSLYGSGEIFCRDAQFLGIEVELPLLPAMHLHQFQETVNQLLASAMGNSFGSLVKEVARSKKEGTSQVDRRFHQEGMVGELREALHHFTKLQHRGKRFLVERDDALRLEGLHHVEVHLDVEPLGETSGH